jgi:hypothetical protein
MASPSSNIWRSSIPAGRLGPGSGLDDVRKSRISTRGLSRAAPP